MMRAGYSESRVTGLLMRAKELGRNLHLSC